MPVINRRLSETAAFVSLRRYALTVSRDNTSCNLLFFFIIIVEIFANLSDFNCDTSAKFLFDQLILRQSQRNTLADPGGRHGGHDPSPPNIKISHKY